MISEFQSDYSDMVVSEVLPDYADMMVQADNATRVLAEGRARRDSARDQVERYMDTFKALRAIVDKLNASRDDLNAKRLALRLDARRFTTRAILMIAAPVAVAIVAALFKCL